LNGRTVAIIGYGSQGHAHALNLRDSGVDVVVGLHAGSKSRAKAEAAGLKVLTTAEAAKAANVIMILVPDHTQGELYHRDIEPNLTPGKTLLFAHGFAIHFKQIVPPEGVDVSMVAPKPPAIACANCTPKESACRRSSRSIKCHWRSAGTRPGYALALGCLKAGVIETVFREETESDLFGEQPCCAAASAN